MLIAYKEKTDKKDNINRFSVGDRVLMKRIFGPHKKMSVRWKEDKKWASVYCCYDYPDL